MILAAGADGSNLILFAVFVLEFHLDFEGAFAPQVGGVEELHFAIFDEQVNRLGAGALQDDAIVTGVFHLRGEMPAHGGAGIAAGEGRFGGPIAFAAARDEHAR